MNGVNRTKAKKVSQGSANPCKINKLALTDSWTSNSHYGELASCNLLLKQNFSKAMKLLGRLYTSPQLCDETEINTSSEGPWKEAVARVAMKLLGTKS
jgi:hypothetical protein